MSSLPASVFFPLAVLSSLGVYVIALRYLKAKPIPPKAQMWVFGGLCFTLGMVVAWDIGLVIEHG